MAEPQEPVILELAPLPREQIGPFLLLGVDKDAAAEAIEASWAQRVIWARKNQIRTPLGDINWAREVITDLERRVRADLTSLNTDSADGLLQRLAKEYEAPPQGGVKWLVLDVEKPVEDYVPPTEIPDMAAVQASIVLPELSEEVPAVCMLLNKFVQEPLDPWSLSL
jgi:hypothetical protein